MRLLAHRHPSQDSAVLGSEPSQGSRADVSPHCGSACPALLPSRATPPCGNKRGGGPLHRCPDSHSSAVAGPLRLLMVGVSCFEVEPVRTQESALKRMQPHVFPPGALAWRCPSRLSVPRAVLGICFPLIFTGAQAPTQPEVPRGPQNAGNFGLYSGFTRWSCEEIAFNPDLAGSPPAPGSR